MNSSHPISRIRQQHAPEFKRELVALCQPGVSVSAIALAHGVKPMSAASLDQAVSGRIILVHESRTGKTDRGSSRFTGRSAGK